MLGSFDQPSLERVPLRPDPAHSRRIARSARQGRPCRERGVKVCIPHFAGDVWLACSIRNGNAAVYCRELVLKALSEGRVAAEGVNEAVDHNGLFGREIDDIGEVGDSGSQGGKLVDIVADLLYGKSGRSKCVDLPVHRARGDVQGLRQFVYRVLHV